MSVSTLDPNSFDRAFAVLEQNATRLRTGDPMQIDDLLPIVEESTAAYKICKDRLERVRAALKQHLDSEAPGETPNGKGGAPDNQIPDF